MCGHAEKACRKHAKSCTSPHEKRCHSSPIGHWRRTRCHSRFPTGRGLPAIQSHTRARTSQVCDRLFRLKSCRQATPAMSQGTFPERQADRKPFSVTAAGSLPVPLITESPSATRDALSRRRCLHSRVRSAHLRRLSVERAPGRGRIHPERGLAVRLERATVAGRRTGARHGWGGHGRRRGRVDGRDGGAGVPGCGWQDVQERTPAWGTRSLAAVISFGAIRRTFVPYAEASGMTSRQPVPASKPTAFTCPTSSGAAATRMISHWARTLPPAAGATGPRAFRAVSRIPAQGPVGQRRSPVYEGYASKRLQGKS